MTDPAVAKARGVVGLYGDPTVSWSIGLDVSFTIPYDAATLVDRCVGVYAANPHLGTPPSPRVLVMDGVADELRGILDEPYGDRDPLTRLAVAEDGSRLMVAAHHGAVDGLGLLALLGLLLGEPVVSTAQGIGDRASRTGFLRSSAARLGEALLRPPTRLVPDWHLNGGVGDVTARRDLPSTRASTARWIAAAAQAVAEWNNRQGVPSDRLVVAVGASRRDGSAAHPDRDTAYLRLSLPSVVNEEEARRRLAGADPEPTFPDRPAGRWATGVTRALRNRLGSSLLVSNLGLVSTPPGVRRLAFYPSAAGPRALAVGVASTSSYTTITVRMPRADFGATTAEKICALVADRLRD